MIRLHPFSQDHFDVVLDAYEEIGLRAVVAPHFNDLSATNSAAFWDEEVPASEWWRLSGGLPTFPKDVPLAELIRDTVLPRLRRPGIVTLGLGPSAPERCSQELLEVVAAMSERHDLQVFTHVAESRGKTLHARLKLSEYGHSHIRYLAACGLLGKRLTLAHSVWLDQEEIEMIAEAGTSVVLNPQGNLKTRSGIAPIGTYRDAGVNVALGCDNCSCNDSQSMLQTMKAYAGLAAVQRPIGDIPSAADAFHAATQVGARAVGVSDIGVLAPGMKADITLFRLDDICFVPLNSAIRQLVFGDAGPALDKVIVNGRLVVDEGRLLTIDVEALRRDAELCAAELREELGRIADRVRPLYGDIERAAKRALSTEWRLAHHTACCPASTTE
jgi:guanine deaminase